MKHKVRFISIISCFLIMSCEDFVDIETPSYKMVTQTVFSDNETAIAAVQGIYNRMYNSSEYAGGNYNSVTVLAGMSCDILQPIKSTNSTYGPFYENEILTDTSSNLGLWSSAYNVIYMANSVLEGLENSIDITEEVQKTLEGQARFIRAFTYFYLTNLYGDVPLILSTDYQENALISRHPASIVMDQVAADLDEAIDLLETEDSYKDSERTSINRYVALAMRARVYLFQQNWKSAEDLSSLVIDQTFLYEILEDLDQVFLMNSREAIWQLSPLGRGASSPQTIEGSVFIIHPTLPFVSNIKLSNSLVSSLKPWDKRLIHWIGFHKGLKVNYPFKYKVRYSTGNVTEYSMVLRLAEQYLIRAEARTMQGNLAGAITDLDKIRGRANLELISDINPGISKEDLLEVIMQERKLEMFSEWGHRWFDLKRKEIVSDVLAPIKSNWQNTDKFYPIPESERMKNPNLDQNAGY